MSFARLQQKIDAMQNPTVVGLDPDLKHIPPQVLDKHIAEHGETLEAAALAVLEFNLNLINGLCDIVPAVKPQSAYYEMLGVAGISTLKRTCDYAKSKGMYVIIDGKRGDIGTTAEAYSAAYLGAVNVGNTEFMPFNADALTINTYLGSDGILPFIETAVKYDKAVFALVKTSNPSSGELQDRECNNGCDNGENGVKPPSTFCHNYEIIGDLIEKLSGETLDENGYTCAGAVVGATYPEQLKLLRERLRHTFFLVPGYGAQGGGAEDVKFAFDKNGHGALVNSSRGIIAAWKAKAQSRETDHDRKADHGREADVIYYADAAREEAMKMRDELRRVMK